jgi:hypothetical protein
MSTARDQLVTFPPEVWDDWSDPLLYPYDVFDPLGSKDSNLDWDARWEAERRLFAEPRMQALDIELQNLMERREGLRFLFTEAGRGYRDVLDISERDGVRIGITRLAEATVLVTHEYDEYWVAVTLAHEELEARFASVLGKMYDYANARLPFVIGN